MQLRKVIFISSLLTLGAFVIPSMGMMGYPGPSNASASSETWNCKCGKTGLTNNFCIECGQARPTANHESQNPTSNVDSRIIILDGPGMANEGYWKHKILDGGWITPQGNFAMNISGFDCELGIYKLGEPDNFRWEKDRFYFAGWQKSKDRKERFDLLFSTEPTIKDAEGNTLVTIKEVWHENISIYMIVKYQNESEWKTIELRKPETMRE